MALLSQFHKPPTRIALAGGTRGFSCLTLKTRLRSRYFWLARYPKGASPLVLLALLLFAVPLLLTLQKFVALLELGERSHKLLADPYQKPPAETALLAGFPYFFKRLPVILHYACYHRVYISAKRSDFLFPFVHFFVLFRR